MRNDARLVGWFLLGVTVQIFYRYLWKFISLTVNLWLIDFSIFVCVFEDCCVMLLKVAVDLYFIG